MPYEKCALCGLLGVQSIHGQASPAAQACLEAGFADFATLRQDPDLAPLRGPELEKLLSRCARKAVRLDNENVGQGRNAAWKHKRRVA